MTPSGAGGVGLEVDVGKSLGVDEDGPLVASPLALGATMLVAPPLGEAEPPASASEPLHPATAKRAAVVRTTAKRALMPAR
jgi:hypothetical protein